jgi:hypothetical protein
VSVRTAAGVEKELLVPRSWYVIARLGQGFAAGVGVGVIWALWIVRRRRPGPVITTG